MCSTCKLYLVNTCRMSLCTANLVCSSKLCLQYPHRSCTRFHTLMDMRMDLTAVPHAGLRNQIQKPGKGGCAPVVKGHETTSRRDDDVPCMTADALALYKKKKKKGGHQLRLTMRPGAPSRYVFTTAWMGLRWPMPSKCPWAPC